MVTAALGVGIGGIPYQLIGTMIRPFEQEYDWSRAQISLGLTIISYLAPITYLAAGASVDRFGARPTALTGALLFGLGFMLMGFAGPQLWTWYATCALFAILQLRREHRGVDDHGRQSLRSTARPGACNVSHGWRGNGSGNTRVGGVPRGSCGNPRRILHRRLGRHFADAGTHLFVRTRHAWGPASPYGRSRRARSRSRWARPPGSVQLQTVLAACARPAADLELHGHLHGPHTAHADGLRAITRHGRVYCFVHRAIDDRGAIGHRGAVRSIRSDGP